MNIILRIDDVGRLHMDTPNEGSDKTLSYFAHWRKVAGLHDLPVYYGVVPKWIHPTGLEWIRKRLSANERVAVHGYDHEEGAKISRLEMKWGLDNLRAIQPYCYIAPFNKYNEQTIEDWASVGGRYFLGGFNGQDHFYGSDPCYVPTCYGAVLHVSAFRELYGRAHELTERLSTIEEQEFPVVLTLHVPWEKDIEHVRLLVEVIKDQLVHISEADRLLLKKMKA